MQYWLRTVQSYQIVRFILVGISNTLVNFILLNAAYYGLHLGKLEANIVATCGALILSFFLNRNFVFAHKGHWRRQFLTFLAVTAVGTLLINNAMYALALQVLVVPSASIVAIARVFHLALSADFVHLNLSSIVATLFSMVWNYVGYQKIVFRKATVHVE